MNLESSLILLGVAIVFFTLGIGGRLGYFKSHYIGKPVPGLPARTLAYAYVPAGLFVLFLVAANHFSVSRWRDTPLGLAVLSGFLIILLVPMLRPPRWLKPDWINWLEDNYGHVLPQMYQEANRTSNWSSRMKTQADVEAWADQVAQKCGWVRWIR
jgi:hypothetical protein